MNHLRRLMFAALAAVAVLGCCDTLDAQPQLTVTPASVTNVNTPLSFTNVPSGSVSAAQTITVSTGNNTTASVIVQVSPSSPWISVGPAQSVNIPATLSVQANATNLTSGNYNGSFTISVANSSTPDFVTVYVSLNVTGASLLYASPPSLTFSAQQGSSTATPNGTSVQILSSGTALNYSLQTHTNDGGSWLLLSALSGSTGGPSFTVSVNPSALSASAYPAIFNGNITATSTTLGATNNSVIIPVQLTLNSTAQLSVTPTNPPPFLYQAGTATDPTPQQLAISSTGGSLAFSVQESPAVSWLVLSAFGGTAGATATPITMNATPVENGLGVGTYTTSVIITPSGESALPPVPVTLVVAAHPLLQLSTNTLSFVGSFAGTPPPAQSVTVTGSGGAAVGFAVTSNASWLIVNASANTTPATLTVQANPAGLAAQNYTGTVTISPTNGDTYTETVAVSLSINAASQLVAGPQSLLFSYEIGQQQPQPQQVQIMTTGQPLSFAISGGPSNCGTSWLAASQNTPSGQATSNTTLTVSVVTTGLAAGSCSGTILLNYNNGLAPTSLAIPVTLDVASAPELSINVMSGFGLETLSQTSPPVEQQVSLTSTDPNNQVGFNAAVINASGPWVGIVGSSSGETPQNLILEYIPAAVTNPGSYTATLTDRSSSLPTGSLRDSGDADRDLQHYRHSVADLAHIYRASGRIGPSGANAHSRQQSRPGHLHRFNFVLSRIELAADFSHQRQRQWLDASNRPSEYAFPRQLHGADFLCVPGRCHHFDHGQRGLECDIASIGGRLAQFAQLQLSSRCGTAGLATAQYYQHRGPCNGSRQHQLQRLAFREQHRRSHASDDQRVGKPVGVGRPSL